MRFAARLRTLLGLGNASVHSRQRLESGRNVIMHVTVDAQHATPLRQALIRDCGDQPWTIRITPLHGTRLRLSLYLPKGEVKGVMQRITRISPAAQFGRLLEIPDTATDAWRNFTHVEAQPRPRIDSRRSKKSELEEPGIGELLSQDHVLLGLHVGGRNALFHYAGRFFGERYALPAESVSASLEAREVLGSTGLGQGVAVPHCRVKGLRQALALYVRPATAIRFDAPDGQPVSDVIILLVPEWANGVHLRLLAEIAQCFCDHHFRDQLHACIDAHSVQQLFEHHDELMSAHSLP
jgi:PTS system nitrogen regulatory IIA component